MECAANYEVSSELSVIADDLVLRIKHPNGRYRARIQNIQRKDYSRPFLLALHLYFDAPNLDDAKDVAEALLSDCLNMLVFATGSKFKRIRIRQIVDARSGNGMRDIRMWSEIIENPDPQPFLNEEIMHSIELLSQFDPPPAIRRAMRWYRLGVSATAPDDQFMNFWFALEIVAEFNKSSEKIPSKCPKCQAPLYCEQCGVHPVHRPYPKDAIRALLKATDEMCDDATIERLDKTRNSLMHGSTLKEIECSLPQPQEEIVDVLGHLLWKALISIFIKGHPNPMLDTQLAMGYPNTYIHRTLNWIAHVQTIVPMDDNGDLDLSFSGIKAEMVSNPPQSGQPTVINMSPEQYEQLKQIRLDKTEYQEMLSRVSEKVRIKDGRVQALVLSTDMALIQRALKKNEAGEWQDLMRKIITIGDTANGQSNT